MYNPVSIARNLEMALDQYAFQESDLFRSGAFWHSFQHPGRFSDENREVVLKRLEKTTAAVHRWLKNTNRLMITLGSSMVYIHREYGGVVANCHKLPSRVFERRRLTVQEVIDHLSPLFQRLRSLNEELQIILTVSPVRHGKEGMHTNQLSKAVLLLAIDDLVKSLDHVHYFPAYELLLDDLRDYRFFKSDLLHPNEMAIDYIWKYFADAFFGEATVQLNQRIRKMIDATQHHPRRPESETYRKFLQDQLERLALLERDYPQLSFRKEREAFELRLTPK
jgi:hypothetical protein